MIGPQDECACPSCSGEEFDPAQLIDALLAGSAELLTAEDPLEAELAGALFVSIGGPAEEGFEQALVGGFIPEFEARANAEALAVLLAISSVTDGEASKAALAAADRLGGVGVPRPAWAAELAEPASLAGCWRLADPEGTGSMLVCAFDRAGRSHALAMIVNNLDCGAASEIFLLGQDELRNLLETTRTGLPLGGVEVAYAEETAAKLRWLAEHAMDARAVHDGAVFGLETDPSVDDEDQAEYRSLAVLFRARLRAFPAPVKPADAPPGCEDGGLIESAGPLLAQLVGNGSGPLGVRAPLMSGVSGGLMPLAALPPKRKKSAPPAPIFQVKVGLRGAKPPIWRRLEVPADISLDRLHVVIQVAFDWYGGHLHVFETDYGEFGTADAELGHIPDSSVTLEQVAPTVGSKIRYTYDFGDDWRHDITVEKILERDSAVRYPRCTGGRRAAPPDDCGGIWGYAELIEILADPAHPEHEDRLEWLGLESADKFEPGRFDAGLLTMSLSQLR